MNKPYSQACENNKRAILDVIKNYWQHGTILEIGSGTGQHAVYFAEQLPNVFWQTSDQLHYHDGINLWLDDYSGTNIGRPLELDVNQGPWPITKADGVFSANTAHIMDWPSVCQMFNKCGELLTPDTYFCLYGPINIASGFTSASNQAFDQQLRQRDPRMGIRDIEALEQVANESGFNLIEKHPMPANNYAMIWRRTEN